MPEMIFSRKFGAGEEIFRMGDRGRNAYIIEHGNVEVSATRDGENVVIAELGKGEIFGEMSMLDDAPRSATVTATEDTEVVCIAKGKAHEKYEFGCKVAVATTNRESFAVASKAFAGNPYDGDTLATTNQQVVCITGVEPTRYYADRGYRGHDYDKRVFISGRRRGLTPTIKRELRRRSASDDRPQTDGRLDRNYLLGHACDAVNALLCAAGHNLRLILNRLRALFALILALLSATENRNTSRHPPIYAQT